MSSVQQNRDKLLTIIKDMENDLKTAQNNLKYAKKKKNKKKENEAKKKIKDRENDIKNLKKKLNQLTSSTTPTPQPTSQPTYQPTSQPTQQAIPTSASAIHKKQVSDLKKIIVDLQRKIVQKLPNQQFVTGITNTNTQSSVWKNSIVIEVSGEIKKLKPRNKPTFNKLDELFDTFMDKREKWIDLHAPNPDYSKKLSDIIATTTVTPTKLTDPKALEDTKKQEEALKKDVEEKKKELIETQKDVEEKKKELIETQKDVFKDDLLNRIPEDDRKMIKLAYSATKNYPNKPLKYVDLKQVYGRIPEDLRYDIGQDKWDKLFQEAKDYQTQKDIHTIQKKEISEYEADPKLTKNEVKLVSWNVKKWGGKTDEFQSIVGVINEVNPDILILQQNNKPEAELHKSFPELQYEHFYQTAEGYKNTILSRYPFKARSYIEFPKVELDRGSRDFEIIFKHENKPNKPKGLFGLWGGAEDNKGYETLEKKNTNNFIIVELELGDGKIFQLINTELSQNPAGLVDEKNKSGDSNKIKEKNIYNEKVRKVYDKVRKKQATLLIETFLNNSQKRWFGRSFSNKPNYQVVAGDFHNIYNSDTLKVLLNNLNSNQNNISNPDTNTEFILFDTELNNTNPDYSQIPHSIDGLSYPIMGIVDLPQHFSVIGKRVPSRPALKQFDPIQIRDPSNLPYTGNKPNKNINVSTKTRKKVSNKKVPNKVQGLNETQQDEYKKLRKKALNKNLTPDEKRVYKKLKNKVEKAQKEASPMGAIGKALGQGLSALGKIQESPCPQVDYLPCFKLTSKDVKNIIDNILANIVNSQKGGGKKGKQKKQKQQKKQKKKSTNSTHNTGTGGTGGTGGTPTGQFFDGKKEGDEGDDDEGDDDEGDDDKGDDDEGDDDKGDDDEGDDDKGDDDEGDDDEGDDDEDKKRRYQNSNNTVLLYKQFSDIILNISNEYDDIKKIIEENVNKKEIINTKINNLLSISSTFKNKELIKNLTQLKKVVEGKSNKIKKKKN
jgi:hypothetical protein